MRENNVEYNRFEKGIDLRKAASVSDANRMRNIENAHVTPGWAIKKREGLAAWLNMGNTVGLGNATFDVLVGGDTVTVYGLIFLLDELTSASVTLINDLPIDSTQPQYSVEAIVHPTKPTARIEYIHHYSIFNGQSYIIAEYKESTLDPTDAPIVHFYNGNDITLTGFRQPQFKPVSAAKLSNRIYAIDGDVVRFSKVNQPSDWVGTDDAGFLGVGLQADGQDIALAVSVYDNQLAVFFEDSIQLWITDPDPALHQLTKVLRNGGTNFPQSIQSFSNDVIYLSQNGFRSISRQQFTDNSQDNDVGSPIDELVQPDIRNALLNGEHVFSVYYEKLGQYICWVSPTKAYVYTRSVSSQVSAWSIYTFSVNITYAVSSGGYLVLRDDSDNIYYFDERMKTDSNTIFKAEVLFSFQSQKAPGISKRYNSMDIVQDGQCDVSHLYNPLDENQETAPVTITGNTRPFGRYPVGVITPEISTRLVNETDEAWRFDALMYFYNKLGVRV